MSGEITTPRTPEEFTEWVRPCLPTIARLASRLAPALDRDDVVQEALARAWVKRAQFDPTRGTAMVWLLAITADQARRARRRRRPWPLSDPGARVRPLEDKLDLEFAISLLPKRQRLAVDCFYFAGLSVVETAAVMRCAEGTVKSSLADARANLRRTLEDPDDGH
jgi:RNA polymerase sigma factor (sigma-70 family)